MLMAARKLQGIGLVLLVLIIAMALYPLYLRVAATRSELAGIERDIVDTRDNVRYLESELVVRASMRQLERWNADSFGYSAPVARQYLRGERSLASLDQLPRARDQMPVAPVLLAMAQPVAPPSAVPSALAATAPRPGGSSMMSDVAQVVVPAARAQTVRPDPKPAVQKLRVVGDLASGKGKLAAVAVAAAPKVRAPKPPAAVAVAPAPAPPPALKSSPERRRKERLALIEDQLLSDATLRDLRQQAAREEGRLTRP
ncbi:MAG: hypothetical protein RLZZ58_2032 [Pseudomonadota bacterium]|jgi:hypothetical protein